MNVLVTGGAGYIGSVVTEECIAAGHRVAVLDTLEKGHREMVHADARFIKGDVGDTDLVLDIFRDHDIDSVIHMAAYSLVGESVEDPKKYYDNNVIAGIRLLDAMVAGGVRKMVFSSTAAVYGEPEKQPVEEFDRVRPSNPYGETKLAFENALHWYSQAYGIDHISLRYFNAAGATALCGELHDPETHLIPIVLSVAAGERDAVEIFGVDYPTRDGTCIRDYIHVRDLARAHVLALNAEEGTRASYNLGCGGLGYTVAEVITTAEEVTGRSIPTVRSPRRAGDPAILIAGSEKIKRDLGWRPEFQRLDLIIGSAWDWMSKRRSQTQNAKGPMQLVR